VPADKRSKPAADRPSSSSSDLWQLDNVLASRNTWQLTKTAPDVAIRGIDFQDGAQILDRGGERIFCAQDACDAHHGWHRPLIELQGLLVTLHGAVKVVHLLGEGA
jgi:hypothetical protein